MGWIHHLGSASTPTITTETIVCGLPFKPNGSHGELMCGDRSDSYVSLLPTTRNDVSAVFVTICVSRRLDTVTVSFASTDVSDALARAEAELREVASPMMVEKYMAWKVGVSK